MATSVIDSLTAAASTDDDNLTPRVVVVGSINCDLTLFVQDFPEAGATVMGNSSHLALGGKGLNQAVAAAKIGAHVHMVACVGDDHFSAMALDYLDANGVNRQHLGKSVGVATGVASILVDQYSHNMIAIAPGANAELREDAIEDATHSIAAADVLLVQMETPLPTIKRALELARENGVLTVVNPAPVVEGLADIIALADVFTPNETEVKALTGIFPEDDDSIRRAMKALRGMGARDVVITRGEHGSSYLVGEHYGQVAPFHVEPVDSTGAGDVFSGVLSAAMAVSKNNERKDNQQAVATKTKTVGAITAEVMAESMQLASAAAAISATKLTAQDAAPNLAQAQQFMSVQIR